MNQSSTTLKSGEPLKPLGKNFLKSKTLWVQVMTIISMLIPAVQGWLDSNPVSFVAAVAALNVLVRFLTHGKISLFSKDGDPGLGGFAPLFVTVVSLGTVLGCVGLTSCSSFSAAASKIDVRTTVDGCLLAGSTTDDGRKIYAGMCADGRYAAKWDQSQPDGSVIEIRYTRFPDERDVIEYRHEDLWIIWDEKTGVQIGGVPDRAEDREIR